jgi:hypothetical protein
MEAMYALLVLTTTVGSVDSLVHLALKEGMMAVRGTPGRGRISGRSGAAGISWVSSRAVDQFTSLVREWREEAESEDETVKSHSRVKSDVVLASHDMRKSFPAGRFATKVSHALTCAPRRIIIDPRSLQRRRHQSSKLQVSFRSYPHLHIHVRLPDR